MRLPVGFTLIETILYTAFLASGMAMLVTFLLSGLNTGSLIRAEQRLIDNQRLVELTVVSRLEESTGLTTPAVGTSDQLVITSTDASENPTTFSVTNGAFYMTLGSQTPVALTGSTVTVANFSVTRLTASPPSLQFVIDYETTTASGVTLTSNSTFSYTLRYE